jgi:hypothetical protein
LKALILAFVMLIAAAGTMPAQRSDASLVVRFRESRPPVASLSSDLGCVNKGIYIASATAVGALAGYGLYAGVYKNRSLDIAQRRRYAIGGALFFGTVAAIHALNTDCVHLPRPR